jgi:hypothetical protein
MGLRLTKKHTDGLGISTQFSVRGRATKTLTVYGCRTPEAAYRAVKQLILRAEQQHRDDSNQTASSGTGNAPRYSQA